MPSAALRVIRPLVRIGSFIAPRTAGRAAFKLFCTPPRPPGPQSRGGKAIVAARARLAPAIRQAVSYPCGTVSTYLFEPEPRLQDADGPAPTVILLHGWNSEAALSSDKRIVARCSSNGSRGKRSSPRILRRPLALLPLAQRREPIYL